MKNLPVSLGLLCLQTPITLTIPTTCLVLKYNVLILLNSWFLCITQVFLCLVFFTSLNGKEIWYLLFFSLHLHPILGTCASLAKGASNTIIFACVLKIEFLILLGTSLLPSFHHAFVSLFMALPILQTLVPSQSYFHPYCLTRSGFFMLIFTLSQSFPAFCISLPRPSSQSLTLAQFPLLLYFYTLSHLSP